MGDKEVFTNYIGMSFPTCHFTMSGDNRSGDVSFLKRKNSGFLNCHRNSKDPSIVEALSIDLKRILHVRFD
eukprot:IDg12674t1